MRTMVSDAQAPVLRAIRRTIGGLVSRCEIVVESLSSERWASATFAGERHAIVVRVDDATPPIDRLRAALADAELDSARYLLIDMALADASMARRDDGSVSCVLAVEALTLDE